MANVNDCQLDQWANFQKKKHALGILSASKVKKLEMAKDWSWDIDWDLDTDCEVSFQVQDMAEFNGSEKRRNALKKAYDVIVELNLGYALDKYTDPSHPEYDPEFDKKIRALRPDWFVENRT